jgi:hypothetical protein
MPSDAPPAIDYSAQICLEALDWAIDFLARCGQTKQVSTTFRARGSIFLEQSDALASLPDGFQKSTESSNSTRSATESLSLVILEGSARSLFQTRISLVVRECAEVRDPQWHPGFQRLAAGIRPSASTPQNPVRLESRGVL